MEDIKAKFYIPSENKYKYIRLKIAPSTIQKAGLGVFAIDPIPNGSSGTYKGVKKSLDKGDPYYSWIIYEYHPIHGHPVNTKEMYLLDAQSKKTSNWTRYVNCGMKKKDNNMDSKQEFDRIYYYATRNINPNEELFIDYGRGYRRTNLGMKGKY